MKLALAPKQSEYTAGLLEVSGTRRDSYCNLYCWGCDSITRPSPNIVRFFWRSAGLAVLRTLIVFVVVEVFFFIFVVLILTFGCFVAYGVVFVYYQSLWPIVWWSISRPSILWQTLLQETPYLCKMHPFINLPLDPAATSKQIMIYKKNPNIYFTHSSQF